MDDFKEVQSENKKWSKQLEMLQSNRGKLMELYNNFQLEKVKKENVIKTYSRRRVHHRTKNGQGKKVLFRCLDCNRKFRKLQNMEEHVRICHKSQAAVDCRQYNEKGGELDKPKPFRCAVCNKKFTTRESIENHLKTGHVKEENSDNLPPKEQTFQCSVCNKQFCKYQTMCHHMKAHFAKPVRVHCEQCPASFTAKKSLNYHVNSFHLGIRPADDPRLCEVCGKIFRNPVQLRNHFTVHTGERRHICSVCGKSFRLRTQITRHSVSHTGTLKYKCSICEKPFFSRYNMKVHERIHSGEKPFKCNICDKSFRVKCSLQSHIKQHTGEKKKRKKQTSD